MGTWNPEQANQAVRSLARIRAVESPPGEDGLKSVWHQGAKGADLLSYVDARGHVTRQELTLLDDYYLWTSQHGLRTGYVVEDGGSMAAKAAATVTLDQDNDPTRILRGQAAMATYGGEDKYIRHTTEVLSLAARGLAQTAEKTVTRSLSKEGLAAMGQAMKRGKWWLLPLIAAAFGLLGFGAAYLATR